MQDHASCMLSQARPPLRACGIQVGFAAQHSAGDLELAVLGAIETFGIARSVEFFRPSATGHRIIAWWQLALTSEST